MLEHCIARITLWSKRSWIEILAFACASPLRAFATPLLLLRIHCFGEDKVSASKQAAELAIPSQTRVLKRDVQSMLRGMKPVEVVDSPQPGWDCSLWHGVFCILRDRGLLSMTIMCMTGTFRTGYRLQGLAPVPRSLLFWAAHMSQTRMMPIRWMT